MGRFRAGRVSPQSKEWISILKEDPCAYCGGLREGRGKTIDHILARNHFEKLDPSTHHGLRVGRDHWTNLTPSCERCNLDKGSAPLLLFLVRRHALLQTHRVTETSKLIRQEFLEWTHSTLTVSPPTESIVTPVPQPLLEMVSTSEILAGTATHPFYPSVTGRWIGCSRGR